MPQRNHGSELPTWLRALLLVASLSILGLGLSLPIGSYLSVWLLLGLSILISAEKWGKTLLKGRVLGRLYRLALNAGWLATLGLLIWSAIKLFSGQFLSSPLAGSLVLLAEFAFFVYVWKVVKRNGWRWPSMKLTIFSFLCIATIFTFAGVHPLSTYKDNWIAEREVARVEKVAEKAAQEVERLAQRQVEEAAAEEAARLAAAERAANEIRETTEVPKATVTPTLILQPKPVPVPVTTPPATHTPTLNNPSWEELKAFLLADKTDELPYIYPTRICEDFATMLQQNAKAAGWRCAIVSMHVTGYDDPFHFGIPSDTGHACNAFETTDRGLVYIDCTGPVGNTGPAHHDRLAAIEVGKKQTNQFIFPTRWYPLDNPSIVVSMDVRW